MTGKGGWDLLDFNIFQQTFPLLSFPIPPSKHREIPTSFSMSHVFLFCPIILETSTSTVDDRSGVGWNKAR